jgi:hypothetical protein
MDEEWMRCYCGEQVAVPHQECEANAVTPEERARQSGIGANLPAGLVDRLMSDFVPRDDPPRWGRCTDCGLRLPAPADTGSCPSCDNFRGWMEPCEAPSSEP